MNWDRYAACFASVNTHFQRELQIATVNEVSGNVLDVGCGSAKLAPHLNDLIHVNSYFGIDQSAEMALLANSVIESINKNSFKILKAKIEDLHDCKADSVVVLNSLYSWPAPERLLRHIHSLMVPGAKLVMANPNQKIVRTMPDLLFEAEKELSCHPFWSEFKEHNIKLVQGMDTHFWKMDLLIKKLQGAGFEVQQCHQNFYLGAMNFIVARAANDSRV